MFLEQDSQVLDMGDDVVHSPPSAHPSASWATSRYAARSGANWPVLIGILAVHAILLGAVIMHRFVLPQKAPQSLAVFDIALQPDTPPPPPPKQKPTPVKLVTPMIVAPRPLVTPPPVPQNIAVTETPPPPQPPVATRAETPPAPSGPVSIGNLSSKMIAATPPRYPVESRRKREQGTVVMKLLLDTEGKVAEIALQRSSGFERLDQAALSAVRRWRWSPIIRNGSAVMVRGVVEIPFVLEG
ncbi:energy transducer TonB [Sphingobium boeckii]|uniref:Protein TonB n=1 Tax=Sphingobium boeckii TaxID=1082345 RepID=A0A7W9EDY6_9SPHN|nr:energy transducer TonB [Sphingobium boeckii]MBB5684440.1 protein TonB [Sphingobium boeckii]